MSSCDEQDLGPRVGRALATITSAPAPAAAIVARGRRIRRRRRAARAGAVAVVAALAVAIPGLLYAAVRSGPPGPPARQLTISQLGPAARGGVAGAGTLDGRPWTVRLAGGPDPVATAAGLPATGHLGTRPGGSDPVTLHAAGSGARRLLAGPVSPGVAYLTMRLAGGATYRLWPVAWHGHRYVGMVVPWNLPVARFTAYSPHGELAYAIPFPRLSGFPLVVSWLRPGAAVPPVSSATVASGANLRLQHPLVGPGAGRALGNLPAGQRRLHRHLVPPHRLLPARRGHPGDVRPVGDRGGRDHRPGRRLHPAAAA